MNWKRQVLKNQIEKSLGVKHYSSPILTAKYSSSIKLDLSLSSHSANAQSLGGTRATHSYDDYKSRFMPKPWLKSYIWQWSEIADTDEKCDLFRAIDPERICNL